MDFGGVVAVVEFWREYFDFAAGSGERMEPPVFTEIGEGDGGFGDGVAASAEVFGR